MVYLLTGLILEPGDDGEPGERYSLFNHHVWSYKHNVSEAPLALLVLLEVTDVLSIQEQIVELRRRGVE